MRPRPECGLQLRPPQNPHSIPGRQLLVFVPEGEREGLGVTMQYSVIRPHGVNHTACVAQRKGTIGDGVGPILPELIFQLG